MAKYSLIDMAQYSQGNVTVITVYIGLHMAVNMTVIDMAQYSQENMTWPNTRREIYGPILTGKYDMAQYSQGNMTVITVYVWRNIHW